MVSKLLNAMLYRQTLLQRSIMCKLKELDLQVQMNKAFLDELKDAIQYCETGFSTLEESELPKIECIVPIGNNKVTDSMIETYTDQESC